MALAAPRRSSSSSAARSLAASYAASSVGSSCDCTGRAAAAHQSAYHPHPHPQEACRRIRRRWAGNVADAAAIDCKLAACRSSRVPCRAMPCRSHAAQRAPDGRRGTSCSAQTTAARTARGTRACMAAAARCHPPPAPRCRSHTWCPCSQSVHAARSGGPAQSTRAKPHTSHRCTGLHA